MSAIPALPLPVCSVYSTPMRRVLPARAEEQDVTHFREYLAVIFTSQLAEPNEEYARVAERMVKLARSMPGFLGMESYREGKSGVTISYWDSEESIQKWRAHPEHVEAQVRGKGSFYKRYKLRVARVFRENDFGGE